MHKNLIDKTKYLEGEAVTIRCAHGDTALYPLGEVEMKLDNRPLTVVAAVSETLPTSVLLGTNVPNLRGLLQENPSIRHTAGVEAVYVVRTRGQTRQEEAEDAMQLQKEKESGVSTKMVDDVETTAE